MRPRVLPLLMSPMERCETMGAWIEVRYCAEGPLGKSYGAGSSRIYEAELALWITEKAKRGPILITEIVALKGELGQLTKVN